MIRWVIRLVAVAGLLTGLILAAHPAGAQDAGGSGSTTTTSPGAAGAADGTSGPLLTLSETSVDPGQQITVIFTGWQGRLVTLSTCSNMAKRGSSDCNMIASQGVRLYHVDASPLTSFVVSTPPGTCPCVIRASSDTGELAYAPIDIKGVATGPVVDPSTDQAPLDVAVHATPKPDGIFGALRSWLGGPTRYEVRVTVQNQATEAFSTIGVHGRIGRDVNTDLAAFDLAPGVMAAGQTWTGTAIVTVPAPVIGNFDWQVLASGAGPVTETTEPMRVVPWILVVLMLVLVGDVVAVLVRWLSRRRARRAAANGGGAAGDGDPGGPVAPGSGPGGSGPDAAAEPYPWLPPPPSAPTVPSDLVGASSG